MTEKILWVKCCCDSPSEASEEKLSLAEMQEVVGGYVERVPLHHIPAKDRLAFLPQREGARIVHVMEMYVNEDGYAMGLEPNFVASYFAQQFLLGNVVMKVKATDEDLVASMELLEFCYENDIPLSRIKEFSKEGFDA